MFSRLVESLEMLVPVFRNVGNVRDVNVISVVSKIFGKLVYRSLGKWFQVFTCKRDKIIRNLSF